MSALDDLKQIDMELDKASRSDASSTWSITSKLGKISTGIAYIDNLISKLVDRIRSASSSPNGKLPRNSILGWQNAMTEIMFDLNLTNLKSYDLNSKCQIDPTQTWQEYVTNVSPTDNSSNGGDIAFYKDLSKQTGYIYVNDKIYSSGSYYSEQDFDEIVALDEKGVLDQILQ